MLSPEIRLEIENELGRAEKARQEGYEGRARVCARRAAGILLREYFRGRGFAPAPVSAMDTLQLLRDDPDSSPELRQIASLFLTRVNEEFQLPVEGDLIAAAHRLVQILEKDII